LDSNQVVSQSRTKFEAAAVHFKDELGKLRTGRANASMLDGLMVEAYGQPMPLKAVANVTAPEAQLIQITPFDANNLQAIAEAIRNDQSLGLTPTDDGHVVRITMPPMTTENRESMVKILHQKMEEAMITARNIRHEAIRQLEQAEKTKEASMDDKKRAESQLDELMTKQKNELDLAVQAKEREIMTV